MENSYLRVVVFHGREAKSEFGIEIDSYLSRGEGCLKRDLESWLASLRRTLRGTPYLRGVADYRGDKEFLTNFDAIKALFARVVYDHWVARQEDKGA